MSSRVPAQYERLVTKRGRAARTSKSDVIARYVIEKSLETEFQGISFRHSLSGREAYLTGHRVAVWEVVAVHEETKSAKAFPDEISRARDGEAHTASVTG